MSLLRHRWASLALAATIAAPAAVVAGQVAPVGDAHAAPSPSNDDKGKEKDKGKKDKDGSWSAGDDSSDGNGQPNGNGNGQGGGDTGVPATGDAPGAPGGGAAPTRPAPASDTTTAPAATPVAGKTVVTQEALGTVLVKLPGADDYKPLDGGAVPLSSQIDATAGKVTITTSLPGGAAQSATFWGGEFVLKQSKTTGMVTIKMPKLTAREACAPSGTAATASAARRHHRLRSLWVADNHGRFKTHGRNSVASVRGTVWVTRERCDGTFTYVRKGRVDVRDRHSGRVVHLHAGSGYLARG